MSEHVSGKTAAALALARGASIEAAAKEAGVSGRTLYRWRQDPGFEAEIRTARRNLLDQLVNELENGVREAVGVLREALRDEAPAVRVRAASVLLGALPTITDHLDVAERLAALERAEQLREGTSR